MGTRGRLHWLMLAILMLVTSLVVELGVKVPDAQAIIGRPATPLSYAGVARRTVRRSPGPVVVVGPNGW